MLSFELIIHVCPQKVFLVVTPYNALTSKIPYSNTQLIYNFFTILKLIELNQA